MLEEGAFSSELEELGKVLSKKRKPKRRFDAKAEYQAGQQEKITGYTWKWEGEDEDRKRKIW